MRLNRVFTYLVKIILVLILMISIAAYFIGRRIYEQSIAASPLGLDIDFNGDGEISFLEAVDGSEIKSSSVIVDGKKCIDYLEPKTGSTWRLICNQSGSVKSYLNGKM